VRERLDRQGAEVDYQGRRDTSDNYFHVARMNVTAGLIAWPRPGSVLDPACGEGVSILAAHGMFPFTGFVGDIGEANVAWVRERAPDGWSFYVGDAEQTIRDAGKVELIVLTEFLEHIEDPVGMLRLAREHARIVVCSSPEMRPGQTEYNPEHLWAFDGDGYKEMIIEAGWTPYSKTHLAFDRPVMVPVDGVPVDVSYDFQIWVAG